MRLYSIGALLKVILGLSILRVIYHYVHVYEEPLIGLSLGFLGLFLTTRGGSYFFFLLCYKIFSSRSDYKQSSQSYTHSLLFGIWVMINITLMITNHRSTWIAVLSLLAFIVLHVVIAYESESTTI